MARVRQHERLLNKSASANVLGLDPSYNMFTLLCLHRGIERDQ